MHCGEKKKPFILCRRYNDMWQKEKQIVNKATCIKVELLIHMKGMRPIHYEQNNINYAHRQSFIFLHAKKHGFIKAAIPYHTNRQYIYR